VALVPVTSEVAGSIPVAPAKKTQGLKRNLKPLCFFLLKALPTEFHPPTKKTGPEGFFPIGRGGFDLPPSRNTKAAGCKADQQSFKYLK